MNVTRLLFSLVSVLVLLGAQWTETRRGTYWPNAYEVAEDETTDSALEARVRRN
jgi:hypothetical protein